MSCEHEAFKECYQVKVNATMTNELKCLYEKLGPGLFEVEILSDFSALLGVGCNPTESELNLTAQLLETEFDKCDCEKVTFTLYVELPSLILSDVDDDQNAVPDQVTLPVEFRIRTDGHLRPVELKTFTIYPLTSNCNVRGFEDECWSYEQSRVECLNVQSSQTPCALDSNYFRLTFPLNRSIACLIPEFGLSGFYLKNLVSAELKTKVRLCPGNGATWVGAGLLSYDSERCEACLEWSSENYADIVQGYEHLFGLDPRATEPPTGPTLEELATARRLSIKGVSKCTEKVLYSFELCFNPPLISTEVDSTMNYRIIGNSGDEYCYEFKTNPETID